MSYTTIYKIGNECEKLGDVDNSWRGAMYVWDQIAKDYFGLDSFPMLDKEERSNVWNAEKSKPLSKHEEIVLRSTMDKVVISKENKEKLVCAFKEYHKEHPNGSHGEQAEIIEKADLNDTDFIAFQQTSCGDFWGEGDYDEESGECQYYNPNTGDKHWELFADKWAYFQY